MAFLFQEEEDSFVVENDFVEYESEIPRETMLADDSIIHQVSDVNVSFTCNISTRQGTSVLKTIHHKLYSRYCVIELCSISAVL